MKKLLVLFLILSLKGTAQTPTTPVAYNNYLASYTDSLFAMGQQWGKIFGESYKSGDYSAIVERDQYMKKFIDKGIRNIEQMKDLKDSKPLRMAMIDFLKYEKNLVETAFKPFETFNAQTPADTLQAAIASLTDISKGEEGFLKNVSEAQEKYASQNGFKIEDRKGD